MTVNEKNAPDGGHPHKVPVLDLMNRKENPGAK
jgi:hypothetical protein